MDRELKLVLSLVNGWWSDFKSLYNSAGDAHILFNIDLQGVFKDTSIIFNYNPTTDLWEYGNKED